MFKPFRGFLKGDKTLGQASLKLSPFDNRCEIHECLNVSNVWYFFELYELIIAETVFKSLNYI